MNIPEIRTESRTGKTFDQMTPEEKESYIYEHGTVIEDDRDRYDRYARSH